MRVKKDFILKTVGDQIIVVPVGKEAVKFHGMISLNETGRLLFEYLSEDKTIEALKDLLVQTFDISEDTALNDVLKFIKVLETHHILE